MAWNLVETEPSVRAPVIIDISIDVFGHLLARIRSLLTTYLTVLRAITIKV